jgi:hypothetical protein
MGRAIAWRHLTDRQWKEIEKHLPKQAPKNNTDYNTIS